MLSDAIMVLESLGILSAIRAAVLVGLAVYLYRRFTG